MAKGSEPPEGLTETALDDPEPVIPTGVPSLLVLRGPTMGRQHDLVQPLTVIGRTDPVDILIPHDTVSRAHTRVCRNEEGGFAVEDLGSTNGTFVNDEKLDAVVVLNDGDLIRVGSAVLKFFSGHSVESTCHRELYQLSTKDGLTKAYNKRYLLEALASEINRSQRHGSPLSVVMLDIDFFKSINDQYGHLAGDGVLQELVRVVEQNIRREDLLARFGGEEFALILPTTPPAAAAAVGEKLRAAIDVHEFVSGDQAIDVTVSVGIYGVDQVSVEPRTVDAVAEEMIGLADAKLYEAKAALPVSTAYSAAAA
jgi:diguanylate cyclase (GGDEF)-like protein